mmetsp:Transcript_19099/g.42223  ORF Transcript_19099/g.42223 Transcript_19099/m.42223 type:complete len:665 (-) Transcript_19099:73-2067(-)
MRVSVAFVGGVVGVSVTPLEKVVQMLGDMLAKSKSEKHDEVLRFNTFKQWCDDTMGEKSRAISDEKTLIEKLTASIDKGAANIAHLTKELGRLEEDLAAFQGDIKAATGIRKKDHANFKEQHQDYSESIDALERGIAELQKRSKDIAQKGDALLQVTTLKSLPEREYRVLQAFLQAASTDDGVPEANAYESQTGGVVDMLDKLRRKFQDERLKLEKEEAENKYAFEMTKQGLADNIEQSEEESATKTEDKQKAIKKKAGEEKDLEVTKNALAEDSSYFQDTKNMCLEKAEAYENRQVTRAGEIEAIEKALEILGSKAVKGNAEKHLPQLVQRSTSFAQLRSSSKNDATIQRVVQFLQHAAEQLNSKALTIAAVQASEDPFKKVKKMIEDLITRLMEEANEEAAHKGFCDTELGTNKFTRDEKTASVEKLTAEVDERTAKDSKLKDRLAKLNADVAELSRAMSEAEAARSAEKQKNAETVADAKEGQAAVTQALEVLKNFYAQNAANTDLVQGPAEDAPETFDEPERGQQSASTGVIGMLEVILSDFTRLQSETSSDEDTAAAEHQKFLDESNEDKALKEQDIETYTAEMERNSHELHDAKNELGDEQAELGTANEYYEDLKTKCVKQPVSYEERVKQREAEVESLKQALQILGGDSNILDSQGA